MRLEARRAVGIAAGTRGTSPTMSQMMAVVDMMILSVGWCGGAAVVVAGCSCGSDGGVGH